MGERGWDWAQVGPIAQREGRLGAGGPAGEARLLAGGALGNALWSLVRRAQNPFSRQIRRCGLKGSVGAGGRWPLSGQGRVGFLGTRSSGCWGCERLVGKEPNSTGTHSQGHLPLPSPRPGVALAAYTSLAVPKAEKGVGGRRPRELPVRPWGSGCGKNRPSSARLPPAPSDPPLGGRLWPPQRWVGA